MNPNVIRAIIFDLDGVITDTAEYHFLAWKRLADEEGLPFTREDNEHLRGVSRRESLSRMLKGAPITEEQANEMMARKNGYYREYLTQVTTKDLLPGVAELLYEIKAAGIKTALASASRNAPDVIERLGIRDQLNVLSHGGMVHRQKPAPDLFLYAARELGIPPAQCLVIEDAQAGIEAAHAAGMVAVGLGPAERAGAAQVVLTNLENVTLSDLTYAATYRVAEPVFEAESQHHRETIFTLGNGYLSTRGTFEERFPADQQATLIHGLWDDVPISLSELANAPDWTSLEIWINGQRFDMTEGKIDDYARYLDLRHGTLKRRLLWRVPANQEKPIETNNVELEFERFTSLADEHILAQRLRVTSLNRDADVQIHARLDSHVENQGIKHWDLVSQQSRKSSADLVVRTRKTAKILALSTQINSQNGSVDLRAHDCPGCPGVVLDEHVRVGETLTIDKITAIYSSRDTDSPLETARKLASNAGQLGYDKLLKNHKIVWKVFWDQSDVIIEGDDEAQLALRHAIFQLRIAAPSYDERVSMGAKTLSGFGYRGHTFWDNEIFVIPFFTYTQPIIARNMLMYRYHCLPGARRKAAGNGYAGAQFPWESAETGDEVTPTWVPHFDDPTQLVRIWTGDIQIHISADIAYAMHQYWRVTGDDDFWCQVGIPVLLETAFFWGDRAEPEGSQYAIRDVIGPDENHDHVDNNQFTNFMARWHLDTALKALDWLERHDLEQKNLLVSAMDLTTERLAHWKQVIDGLILFHDPETGLIEQFEGFYDLKDVDWDAYQGRRRSMQEILGIEGCTEYKALKQADVVALLCLLGDEFDEKTWKANWDYYEPITDHAYGSSLGPSMHAWAACRMEKPDDGYQHFMRAARADLLDVRGNAGDGIHAASAGGLWEAVVFGFAGLKLTTGGPVFHAQFPSHWKRVTFHIQYHGKLQRVDLSATST